MKGCPHCSFWPGPLFAASAGSWALQVWPPTEGTPEPISGSGNLWERMPAAEAWSGVVAAE